MHHCAGVTVLELLIVVTVLSLLAGIGLPTFRHLVVDLRMTAQVNELVRAIHLAKQEAYKRSAHLALCKTRDERQCTGTAAWHDGWLVFVNRDRDHPPRVDAGERILLVHAAFDHGQIIANRRAFVFRPLETRSTNGTFLFCDHRGPIRAVVVSYTGRPRLAAPSTVDNGLHCST